MSKCVVYSLSIFLMALSLCVNRVYENVTPEQSLFHLQFILDTLIGNQNMSLDVALIVLFFVLVPALFSAMIFCLIQIVRLKIPRLWIVLCKRNICMGFLAMSSANFIYQGDFQDFYRIKYGDDLFSHVYVKPGVASIRSGAGKKNLILIYVESLESSMRNQGIHGINIVERIDNLGGYDVENFPSAPGTNWTIAGMIASQCSIPVKTYFTESSALKGEYLPNAVCLGDVLHANGYEQFFLGGSDLTFTGKDKFFRTHGYQHAYGSDQWKEKGLDPGLFGGWGGGIHDDTLLAEAKNIIAGRKSARQPYNLTLLTLDTHAFDGYPSPRCLKDEKGRGITGVYQCTSRFIGDFIEDLERENLLDDTVVVIMGDHPFHNSARQVSLFPEPRNVYMKFIFDGDERPKRNRMTHFDVAPSILELIGFSGGVYSRFGLGVSVFSDVSAEEYGNHFDKVTSRDILNYSEVYESFHPDKK